MPVWLQILLGAASAVVAGASVFVAWHQAHTNRVRLRHELYERRFAVFKDVQIALSRFMVDLRIDGETYSKVADAWQRSRFLFDDDISKYIDRIRNSLIPFLKGKGDEEINREKKHWEKLEWLTEQAPVLIDKFAKYLNFRF